MKIIPRQSPRLPAGAVKLFMSLLIKDKLLEGDCPGQFETEFARYIGVKHAIIVSSGRLALYLLLKYFDIGEGDEAVLPSFTCPVVPNTVVLAGGRPIFVDVDPETFNINPSLIEKRITEKTKVIIATHIEGAPCELNRVKEIAAKYGLRIIEDCAQALGAEYEGRRVGSFGDVSYFSFAIGKQINTRGGGIILTNDDEMARCIRDKVSNYSLPKKPDIIKKFIFMNAVHLSIKPFLFNLFVFPVIYLSNLFGKDIINVFFEDKGFLRNFTDKYCVKYSNLQAAIGLKDFEYLDKDNKKRIENAGILDKCLCPSVKRQRQASNTKSAYLYYSIAVNDRAQIKRRLLKYGIDTQESWNLSCSSLELFEKYRTDCPVSDRLSETVLYIPNYPGLNEKSLEYVAGTVNRAIKP